MKNVLVTGVAGFLGSHLALHHLRAGDRVWGVDDFCSSSRGSDHYRELLSYDHFTFLTGDISTFEGGWRQSIKRVKFDLIYNFACPASPPKYQAMPVHTLMTCVAGTKNVLELAAAARAVVVHASTSEVYGDPDQSPQEESYRGYVNSYGPRACYDEGKRAAEALCFDFWSHRWADVRTVRIFNTYGPHMDPRDGRVVSNFICQVLRGEKLTIYGTGAQTRSFCYVDDLIRGIVAMGELSANPGGPINLGNPVEFTVKELADEVCKVVDKEVELEVLPLPVDDPLQRRPDITKAKEILKWEPRVMLAEGLSHSIKYFREIVK